MDQTDEIKSKLDITELISQTVSLKKAGRNLKGLCPFHSEKTPSFMVSPERQIWRCFGCNRGGDAFSFLMELERVEFPEALRILAEQTGVQLKTTLHETGAAQLKDSLREINHLASEYYHYLLTQHAVGERARKYLKKRGITDKLIKTYLLGFAPESWDNLCTFLAKKGYKAAQIEQAGLAIAGKRGHYDRFRSRIVFPLRDHRAAVLGFSGRVLGTDDTQGAKYINIPETPLYHKRRMLYGMDVAKDAIRRQDKAVLVEGEFDVISSFHAGVANTVGIKGSALTEEQVMLLRRFAREIVLALDQDSAGDEATRRGIAIADNAGLRVQVVSIPSGKDPDDSARENAAAWRVSIEKAAVFYDFLLNSALNRFDRHTAYGKRSIADEVLPVYAAITNQIVRAHYLKKLSEALDTDEATIHAMIKKRTQPTAPDTKYPVQHPQVSLDEQILSLVLASSSMPLALAHVTQTVSLDAFTNHGIRKVFKQLAAYFAEHSTFSTDAFVARLPKELVAVFDQAYIVEPDEDDEAARMRQLQRNVLYLKQRFVRRKLTDLTTRLKHNADIDDAALAQLNTELAAVSAELKQLSRP